MKIARVIWSDRYLVSLRAHLDDRPSGSAETAGEVGRAALAGGLAAIQLAGFHEEALHALAPSHVLSDLPHALARRAAGFFTQALGPLEANRRAMQAANRRLMQRVETLRTSSVALARSNRRLAREIVRLEALETKTDLQERHLRRRLRESRLTQTKLHQLTRRLLGKQELERTSISRDLHDEVVQALVGITVNLTALDAGAGLAVRALRKKIARTKRIVETSVEAVHRFAQKLRPTVLDDLGLIPALHAHSKSVAAKRRLRITMTAFRGIEAMTIAKRTVLFRVAQQALDIIGRHADATQVILAIRERPGAVLMEISDNGKLRDPARSLFAKTKRELSLVEMRERIEMIGGTLAIESALGQGTTFRMEIPFKPEPKSTCLPRD